MKKLLFISVVLMAIASCQVPVEKVSHPLQETTLELYSKIDTTQVYYFAIHNSEVYAFNMDKQLQYKLQNKHSGYETINSGVLILLIVAVIGLLFAFLIALIP